MSEVKKKRGWWRLKELPKEVELKRPEDWTDEDKEICARMIATSKTTAKLRREQQTIKMQQLSIRSVIDGKLQPGKERSWRALENMMEVRTWAVSLREFNDFPFFTA